MATSFMQQQPFGSRNESKVELKVGDNMRVRKPNHINRMKQLKSLHRPDFSEQTIAQWAKRAEEKLVQFKSTGEVPDSVFDFD